MKKILLALTLLMTGGAFAQNTATWIWYPGDYEIWLSNQMQNRRTDRGSFFPVFWKIDSHYPLMDFHKDFTLVQPEEVAIYAEGKYNVKLDGQLFEGTPKSITVPAGKHRINVKVFNQASPPAIFVKGKTVLSDASWLVTFEDKEWIDETGKTSDVSATQWLPAGSWDFNDPTKLPSQFKLPTKKQSAVSVMKNRTSRLIDFGKETFGYIKLHGVKGKGNVTLYYGESKEEALSEKGAVALDRLLFSNGVKKDSVMALSKAFRYVNVTMDAGVSIDSVSMLYEYADVKERGDFKCSDDLINRIYEVSKYTFRLNTREFFIDGIKRDRWVWSGDAYQSYLMNYYLYFDNGTVNRTMAALRGKDPVTGHINTIMDYTFYWFIGIYDYYLYTGDKTFITNFYPRMQSMMQYCLGRRNKDGLMEGLPGDWVFIDWADGLSKKGEVSFEQMLLCRSLETMALCARLMNNETDATAYQKQADELKAKLFSIYWNADKGAMVHSRVDGVPTQNVTRYSNMFGIFFNYFNEQQKQQVKQHVLLNDSIQKINTPYMRFYELEALCAMGEQTYVLQQMKDYWGGMLNLGATTFWEEYNPAKKGAEHLAMYGREFGKSLCHAWGASPIYLLGKYYLGVKPTSPAYATYMVQPELGGLQWMQGTVPTPKGNIQVYCSTKEMKVKSTEGTGTLHFISTTKPVCAQGEVKALSNNQYEVTIAAGKEYLVTYQAKSLCYMKNVKYAMLVSLFALVQTTQSQTKSLVNTTASPHAKFSTVNMGDVQWTTGFWADRFRICKDSMLPQIWNIYTDTKVAHALQNFEIAAGLDSGKYVGPTFQDGDFYKVMEAMAAMYAATKDPKLDRLMDSAITIIGKAQRSDGYIYTKSTIDKKKKDAVEKELGSRLSFEAYNIGHLMTAGCVHYRATGKTSLLSIAQKAGDFLISFYDKASNEQARNAICPSHYMGLTELYRTTHEEKYLKLVKHLIDVRGLVEGTDDNSDRVPFRRMQGVVGHAVRANYLFAGAADVYAETGEDSIMHTLDLMWDDVTNRKMYITGGCGALYDGVSVDGTSYNPDTVQRVHQSYGRKYQLPNLTAYNETCANVGNLLWNWRMFQTTGEGKYMDLVELELYNSILSGVSLNGKNFFYTNPLARSNDFPYQMRWSGGRIPYIAYSNCCPPNVVRTMAEVSNYAYSISDKSLWVNLYGANDLNTKTEKGESVQVSQQTTYPWDGNIQIKLAQFPKSHTLFIRVPGWSTGAVVKINGQPQEVKAKDGYIELKKAWNKNDMVSISLPMPAQLMEANPLVEEARGQVAVKRGPVVYCLESADLPATQSVFNISLPAKIVLQPQQTTINNAEMMSLKGNAILENDQWKKQLYQPLNTKPLVTVPIKLIPYYAWANRGKTEMTVWIPVVR